MIRRDEGYALPFVLVVLVVLCIIAVGVMDFSLRNLETQQVAIQRMKAKYEAASKVEEIVSVMTTKRTKTETVEGVQQDVLADSIVFPGSETLSFTMKNGVLRIAATYSQNENEQLLWIIAAVKPETMVGGVTGTGFGTDSVYLTVNYCGKIQYLWYEVVDEEKARNFIEPESGVPSYDPYA